MGPLEMWNTFDVVLRPFFSKVGIILDGHHRGLERLPCLSIVMGRI